MPNQDQSIQRELSKLRKKHEQLRKLVTTNGFIQAYFKELPNHTTRAEAFNTINELYHELTGEYKYSTYKSFSNAVKRYYKNQ